MMQTKQGPSSSSSVASSSFSVMPRGSGPPMAGPPVHPTSAAAALSPPIMMYGGGLADPSGVGLRPGPGRPCLQSARLAVHSEHNQATQNPELSKSFMKKIVLLLQEMGMPDRLLPTRTVCDLNDQVSPGLIAARNMFMTRVLLMLGSSRCSYFAGAPEHHLSEGKGVGGTEGFYGYGHWGRSSGLEYSRQPTPQPR
jgi:hypothetical protein